MQAGKTSKVDILARTIYGEARGEYGHVEGSISALISVGNVIKPDAPTCVPMSWLWPQPSVLGSAW
jgi:hypothetical protein